MEMEHYRSYVLDTAAALLKIDSPSGFTQTATAAVETWVADLGYAVRRSGKGNLIVDIPGREHHKRIGLCAHIDTLGLMCRAITDKGGLKFSRIGGAQLPTLDGEYCRIYTRDGAVYTGTILSLSPSSHVFADAVSRPRDEQNMYVRMDDPAGNPAEVRALGIEVGDYICIDPKVAVTGNGYLKSRFIDDKGSVACLLTLLKLLKDRQAAPRYDTELHLTVYEEVGHGGSTISPGLDELLAVDMGCVGDELGCTERQVSICAKDTTGPYDYELVSRLTTLAKENQLNYAVDVYPQYASDVAAAWRAGGDMKAALIGPGVHASHGMERTHWEGLRETIRLLWLYLACA